MGVEASFVARPGQGWLDFIIPALVLVKARRGGKIAKTRWIGYHASDVKRQGRAILEQHLVWRRHVQMRAMAATAGPTWNISGNLSPRGWHVVTQAFFATETHADAENVHKGVVDALVGRVGASSAGRCLFLDDKDLAGTFLTPGIDPVNPRVWVRVERAER